MFPRLTLHSTLFLNSSKARQIQYPVASYNLLDFQKGSNLLLSEVISNLYLRMPTKARPTFRNLAFYKLGRTGLHGAQ